MMKKLWSLIVICCMVLSLCACESAQESTQYQIYFPSAEVNSGQVSRAVGGETYSGELTVEKLLAAQLAEPVSEGLSAIATGDVHVVGWSVVGGLLRLDLSTDYNELTGIDLTLAECCITLTMTQLESVDKVRITVGGRDVAGRSHTLLMADDMIFTGMEEEPREVLVELYFPRSGGRGLGFEIRELVLTEDDDLYAAVTQALLAGPESDALRSIFPEGTRVMSTRMEEGICYVNFSPELVDNASVDLTEQDLLLYSIVDTLGNLEGVSAVQLLVEGAVLKSYGNTDTTLPLEPDLGKL